MRRGKNKHKEERRKKRGQREGRCNKEKDSFQSAVHVYLLYVGWSNTGLSSFTFTMRTVIGVGTLLRGVRPLSATVSSRLV